MLDKVLLTPFSLRCNNLVDLIARFAASSPLPLEFSWFQVLPRPYRLDSFSFSTLSPVPRLRPGQFVSFFYSEHCAQATARTVCLLLSTLSTAARLRRARQA